MSKEWSKYKPRKQAAKTKPKPKPDPRAKANAVTKAKWRRIERESQEILDKCWEALPAGCPMRGWTREQFDTCWGDWDSLATAEVDTPMERDFSIIIAEYITGSLGELQLAAIQDHEKWLAQEGTARDLAQWQSDLLAGKKNFHRNGKRKHRLLILLHVAVGLSHEEGRYANYTSKPHPHPTEQEIEICKKQKAWEAGLLRKMTKLNPDATKKYGASNKDKKELNEGMPISITQAKIEKECEKIEPALFSDMSETTWKRLFKLAVKHWQRDFPKARGGLK